MNFVKCEYMGDVIYVIKDESVKKELPPRVIVYTLEEAQMLKGQSESVRRTAHELKKLGGAIITSSMKRIRKEGTDE